MLLSILTLLEDVDPHSGLQILVLGGEHSLITHHLLAPPVLDLLPSATQQDVLQQTVAEQSPKQLQQLVQALPCLVQTQQTPVILAVAEL
jgi:hypothetical protein